MVCRFRPGGFPIRPTRARPEAGPNGKILLGIRVVIGLGLLTKATAIGLLPLAAATIAWEAWQKARGREDGVGSREHAALRTTQYALRNIILISHRLARYAFDPRPAVVISGWWFYRNFRLYGDWLGLNAFYAVLGTRDVPADFAQLWAERFAFAAGYWGNFGGLNVPMPAWAYAILNTVALVALAGLVLRFLFWLIKDQGLRTKNRESRIENYAIRNTKYALRLWPFTWDALTAARALAWAWPAAIFVSWMRWATVTWSSQGRLIFSAIPMWSLALVWGLTAWIPRRAATYRRTVALDLAAFLLSLSVIALPAWILPAYRPPTIATTELTHPLDHSFGEALRLRGYEIASDVVRAWRAGAPDLALGGAQPHRDRSLDLRASCGARRAHHRPAGCFPRARADLDDVALPGPDLDRALSHRHAADGLRAGHPPRGGRRLRDRVGAALAHRARAATHGRGGLGGQSAPGIDPALRRD